MKNRFQFLFNEAGDGGQGGGGGGEGQQQQQQAPSAFNPDGTLGDNWHAALGDEFTPHAAQLSTYKDVKGLAKSLLHFRANGPAYPGENSGPEDIARFRSMAGVPGEGSAAAYGLKIPDGADDATKARYEEAAKWAYELHMPAPAFAKFVERWDAKQGAEIAEYQSQIAANEKAAEDQLIGDWKGNFEANKSTVRHWTEKLAGEAGVNPEDPSVSAMLSNPAFAKIMLQVSKLSSEDSIRPPGGMGDLRSPQQQADAIMDGTDPVWGHKYTKGSTQEKQQAYDYVSSLLEKAKR